MAGSSEHSNGTLGSIKCGLFLDQLSNHQFSGMISFHEIITAFGTGLSIKYVQSLRTFSNL
jgi:hypothetical protein